MQTIPDGKKISPSLVFFTIHAMQYGMATLGFQRVIAKTAGYDAWISVIIAGILTFVLMWIIFKIIDISGMDLAQLQMYIFGKKIGSVLNIFSILYFCLYVITILRTYIEVVQVWMFEDLNIFWFSLFFLILCIFIVNGGFRTVTAMMFFSVVLPAYLIIIFTFTLPYADFRNLLPVFDHSTKEIITASYQMTQAYMGYEAFLMYHPFVKGYKESKKWVYLALTVSTLLFLFTTIISFAYYSEGQIQNFKWATLSIWKIVHLPVVERFEYVGIANWCLIILPNISFALWCGSRMLKQTLKISQRKGIILISCVPLFVVPFFKTHQQIDRLNYFFGLTGYLAIFMYTPFLLILVWFVTKRRNKSGNQQKKSF